jgi:hypothetical protein
MGSGRRHGRTTPDLATIRKTHELHSPAPAEPGFGCDDRPREATAGVDALPAPKE